MASSADSPMYAVAAGVLTQSPSVKRARARTEASGLIDLETLYILSCQPIIPQVSRLSIIVRTDFETIVSRW